MSNYEQLSNLFVENWTSVFNTILGKDVSIVIGSVSEKQTAELATMLPEYSSYVTLNFSETSGEKIVFGSNNKLISIVSNLMIGLDTFSEDISDDDKDAFSEGINQMFASCQVPIKESMGLDMKFHNIEFTAADQVSGLFPDNFVLWDITIGIPDISEEKFVLLTPASFGIGETEDSVTGFTEASAHGPVQSSVDNSDALAELSGTNIDLILDVELPITIRIGSTEKKLVEIMRLGLGSIIELEKVVDDPIEVLVNNKLVAKGEVVVLDSNFAVRIIEVESREKRIRSLGV